MHKRNFGVPVASPNFNLSRQGDIRYFQAAIRWSITETVNELHCPFAMIRLSLNVGCTVYFL